MSVANLGVPIQCSFPQPCPHHRDISRTLGEMNDERRGLFNSLRRTHDNDEARAMYGAQARKLNASILALAIRARQHEFNEINDMHKQRTRLARAALKSGARVPLAPVGSLAFVRAGK